MLTIDVRNLLITLFIIVNKFLKKSELKICFFLTRRAYKIVFVFQILYSQSFIFVLHTFYRRFVHYFSIILLTLHIVNRLLINYTIYYKSVFKVVNNLLIKKYLKIISEKSRVFEKKFSTLSTGYHHHYFFYK